MHQMHLRKHINSKHLSASKANEDIKRAEGLIKTRIKLFKYALTLKGLVWFTLMHSRSSEDYQSASMLSFTQSLQFPRKLCRNETPKQHASQSETGSGAKTTSKINTGQTLQIAAEQAEIYE